MIVDGEMAITGERDMADEYFDYAHAYNFCDRDALVMGAVVPAMHASFERFWLSDLSAPVESLANDTVHDSEVQQLYRELGEYAANTANFAPEVRAAIDAIPAAFPQVAAAGSAQRRWRRSSSCVRAGCGCASAPTRWLQPTICKPSVATASSARD